MRVTAGSGDHESREQLLALVATYLPCILLDSEGDSGVGKSCIVVRFVTGEPLAPPPPRVIRVVVLPCIVVLPRIVVLPCIPTLWRKVISTLLLNRLSGELLAPPPQKSGSLVDGGRNPPVDAAQASCLPPWMSMAINSTFKFGIQPVGA